MTQRVRVLSLSTLFPSPARPGFGLFVKRQFDALAERGDVDLTLINPVGKLPLLGSSEASELASAYPVHQPSYPRLPVIGAWLNPALIAAAVLPLARQLHAKQPFDVVDAQFFYPDGPAAASVAKALGLPLSIKARGSDIHYWGGRSGPRREMLRAAEQAGGMLAVSAALRDDMAALGMDAGKIAVHYTGLNAQTFHVTPRNTALERVRDLVNPQGPLIVSVGNLIPLKGHVIAIEALGHLPKAHLAIAGEGPERDRLIQKATDLGLDGRVHMLGRVGSDRLPNLLSAATVMVLPSEREGLANAWIEALACGTPLVITDVGGAREVVRDRIAGRLVERSAKAIADAMREIVAHPPPQVAVAETVAGFSWANNAAQLSDHYRKLAAL